MQKVWRQRRIDHAERRNYDEVSEFYRGLAVPRPQSLLINKIHEYTPDNIFLIRNLTYMILCEYKKNFFGGLFSVKVFLYFSLAKNKVHSRSANNLIKFML